MNRATELLTLILAETGYLLSLGQRRALATVDAPEARLNLLLGQLAARGGLATLPPAWRQQATIICEVWAATAAPADQLAAA